MEVEHGLGRDQLVQPDRAGRHLGPLASAPGVIGIGATVPDLLKDHATSLDEDGEYRRQAAPRVSSGRVLTVSPARLRGPARLPIPPSLRRLPSSLVPRSSVQATPRPSGSLTSA